MQYLQNFFLSNIRAGWADVCFEIHLNTCVKFTASYLNDSLTDLLVALITVKKKEKAGYVRFELESEGWRDLMLIMYPSGVVKVEIYDTFLWDDVAELIDHKEPPLIVSFFDNWSNIASIIVKEYRNHKRAEFKNFGYPYPAKELKELERMLHTSHQQGI